MKTCCLHCKKDTDNPRFCSRSCAASFNNKKSVKRQPEGTCFKCSKPVITRNKYCKECRQDEVGAKDMSLKDAVYSKTHRSSAFALIRSRARMTRKAKESRSCEKCGWSHHVEICHIKPISQFDENSMISEINSESNLIVLCPNCHWLFDHKKQ